MKTFYRKLRSLVLRRRKEAELCEELEFHLAEELAEQRAAGRKEEEAQYNARRHLGNVALVTEDTRGTWGWLWLDQLLQDVGYALRMAARAPVLTLAVVSTLALGIGLTTAMFSVVRGVLLRPLPFHEADRLVAVHTRLAAGTVESTLSPPNAMNLLEEDLTEFTRLGLVLGIRATLTGGDEARSVDAARVSATFFDTLHVAPVLGRTFEPSENDPGRAQVAIVSYALWQQQFGGDAGVLGRTIALNGNPHTIVGVMPAGFGFPNACSVWVPQAYGDGYFSATSAEGRKNNAFVTVIGRLRPGATLQSARAELDRFAGRLARRFPEANAGVTFIPVSLHDDMVSGDAPSLWMLLGAACFVLVIAAANVAGLLLARGASRRDEIAMRGALGATPARLVRQFITESVLLGAIGGALGLALSLWITNAVVAAQAERLHRNGMEDAIRIDFAVLAFMLGITFMAGVMAGIVPALRVSHDALATTMREMGSRSAGRAGGQSLRRILVVGEIALAVILLHGAGLLINSFARLTQVDPGFRADNAVAFSIDLLTSRYRSDDRVRAFYHDLIGSLQRQPGVKSVGAISRLPIRMPGSYSSRFKFEGRSRTGDEPSISARIVSPDYFRTMGMTVLNGRGVDEGDVSGAPSVVVINQAAVDRFFPGEDAVGHRLIEFGYDPLERAADAYTIVGVVSDVRSRALGRTPEPQAYFAHAQVPLPLMSIVVRTDGEPMAYAASIRSAITSLDRNVAVPPLRTLDQILSESLARPRFVTILLGALSTVALLLAAVGIFGLVSFAAAQRRREFGVRIALGASPRRLLVAIVCDALVLVVVALALGLGGALLLTRALEGLLYGVSPADPTTFVIVAGTLALTTVMATIVPAWHASSVDPLIALRAE